MKEPKDQPCYYCHGDGYFTRVRFGKGRRSTKERCKNCYLGKMTQSEYTAAFERHKSTTKEEPQ